MRQLITQRAAWITALAVFGIVCIGLAGFSVYWDHRTSIVQSESRLKDVALLLEQHVDRAIAAGDDLVRELAEEAADTDFASEAAREQLHRSIRQLVTGAPQISSAWVLDSQGWTIAENWHHPPRYGTSFAQRQYFQVHRNGDFELHIGRVAQGASSGRSRFTLSRGFRDRYGNFGGVAVAAIVSDYFTDAFQRAGLGARSQFRLATPAGDLLAEWPTGDRIAAENDLKAEIRLDKYPMVVTVWEPRADVLAPWATRTTITSLIATAAIAAFGGLTGLGLQTAKRESEVRQQLHATNESLERQVATRTAALARNQRQTQTVLDVLPVGVAVLDGRGEFIMRNREVERFIGSDPIQTMDIAYERWRDVYGQPLERACHPASRALHGETVYPGVDMLCRLHDGQEVWTRIAAVPLNDTLDNAYGAVVVIHDIDDLKRTEAELAARHDELQVLYDTAPIGLCMLDNNMRFLRVNPRLAEINGVPVGSHVGRTFAEVVPELAAQSAAIFQRIMETGLPQLGVEVIGETPAQPGTARSWSESWVPLRDQDGRIVGINVLVDETTERKRQEEHVRLLINELNHRVKNTLATVQSIAWQALHDNRAPQQISDAIMSRLVALSRSHDLLTRQSWDYAKLQDVVQEALAPFRTNDRTTRISATGPNVRLRPKMALAMGMALHELATNAVKYGALSNEAGTISIEWTLSTDQRLRFKWQESGGPPVRPPRHRGFGSRLLERGLAYDLNGVVQLTYAPEGVVCIVDAPVQAQGGGK